MLQEQIYPQVIRKKWQKLVLILGMASAATLVTIPVLAKHYPPHSLFQPDASGSYPYRNSKRSIADTLAKNAQYASLVYELKKAGLFETLKSGNFTIFAPTNRAFDALPREKFQEYSKAKNRHRVLNYHIVPGKITGVKVGQVSKVTREGSPIKITVNPNGYVKINTANGIHPSTVTKNGLIIEVDKVLFPNQL